LCSVLKDFPRAQSSQIDRKRLHLRGVLKHLTLEKLLSLGFTPICLEKPETKCGMLRVRKLTNQAPNLTVFDGNSSQYLIGRVALILSGLIDE
jgi:hypothetical protein